MSLAAREHWTRGARPDVAEGFAVLTYLVEHAGRLVTHDELLEAVWPNVVVEPQAVKKHILAVRSTLRDRPKNPVFLETMIKRGYRFIAPVSNSSAGGHVERGERAQGALVGRAVALEELREGGASPRWASGRSSLSLGRRASEKLPWPRNFYTSWRLPGAPPAPLPADIATAQIIGA